MEDSASSTRLWYAVVGNNGSVIGMGRLLGVIGAVLLLAFLAIWFTLA